MITKVHFMSKTCEWETPKDLFEKLDAEFHFTLDPCSTHLNAKCSNHFTEAENGLLQSWAGERVFMNPPYGRAISAWMNKAHNSALVCPVIVCLVPARTDTAWWHNYAEPHEVRFIRGRLRFGGGRWSAPFPSAIIVMQAVCS